MEASDCTPPTSAAIIIARGAIEMVLVVVFPFVTANAEETLCNAEGDKITIMFVVTSYLKLIVILYWLDYIDELPQDQLFKKRGLKFSVLLIASSHIMSCYRRLTSVDLNSYEMTSVIWTLVAVLRLLTPSLLPFSSSPTQLRPTSHLRRRLSLQQQRPSKPDPVAILLTLGFLFLTYYVVKTLYKAEEDYKTICFVVSTYVQLGLLFYNFKSLKKLPQSETLKKANLKIAILTSGAQLILSCAGRGQPIFVWTSVIWTLAVSLF